jgi:hypothetical protein
MSPEGDSLRPRDCEGTLSGSAETVRPSRGHREGKEDVESGKASVGQKASELTPLLTAQKGQQ